MRGVERSTRPVESAPASDTIPPEGSRRPPVAGRASRPRRDRAAEGRVLLAGLIASALIHAGLLLVFRYSTPFDGGSPVDVPTAAPRPASGGTRVVTIRPVPHAQDRQPAGNAAGRSAPASVTSPAPDDADPQRTAQATNAPAPPTTQTPARDRFSEAVEALRPRLLDPRLRPGNLDALRTDHERAALRAYARIHALNDSILAEIERGQRGTDWTWTDEEGRRWGLSPGKLHLGGVEIPLPAFSPTADQRERYREWAEIRAQADQGAIDETFVDRVEAIRERRDAEREAP